MINSPAKPSLSFFWINLRPFKKWLIVVMLIVFIDSLLAGMGVGIILPMIQTLLEQNPSKLLIVKIFPSLAGMSIQHRILVVSAITFVLFLSRFVIGLLRVGLVKSFAEKLRRFWSCKIGENIVHGPYQYYIEKPQGAWLNDWLTEPISASAFCINYINYMSSITTFIILMFLGVMISWKVMLSVSIVLILILFLVRKFTQKSAIEHSRNKSKVIQRLSSLVNECLTHIKDIKTLNAENHSLGKISDQFDTLRNILVKAQIYAELPRLSGELFASILISISLIYLSYTSELKMEDFLPFLAFYTVLIYRLITSSMGVMTSRIKAFQEFHSLVKVQSLSSNFLPHNRSDDGLDFDAILTDISFNNVEFGYNSKVNVIRGANFILHRGKLTVLSGKSGHGKTTLIDLLLRLIAPQAGKIEVNNLNIMEFNLAHWRKCFGYVSQDAALFHGSILENLTIGLPEVSQAEIERACEMAGCLDFISGLPANFNTMVGERGLSLSGGQRKRIAIARALLRKPQFLILDETTTSFEISIEKEILYNLRNKIPKMAIVLISHRVNDDYQPDYIITIDKGIVVA